MTENTTIIAESRTHKLTSVSKDNKLMKFVLEEKPRKDVPGQSISFNATNPNAEVEAMGNFLGASYRANSGRAMWVTLHNTERDEPRTQPVERKEKQ